METKYKNIKYAICIENRDSEDLEKRKVYHVLRDEGAEGEGYFRVIDESGEDYLYPQSYFVLISLPQKAEKALHLSE